MLDTSGWSQGRTPSGIQVRYTAQDVPISPWLAPSAWTYTITQDSPYLANLNDGVLDLSLQVMGTNRLTYRPWPAFLHLKRNRTLSALVPVMVGDNPTSMGPRIPGVTRVAKSERRAISERVAFAAVLRQPEVVRLVSQCGTPPDLAPLCFGLLCPGYPANPSLTRWSTPPQSTALYLEQLTPGGDLFEEMQMWWEVGVAGWGRGCQHDVFHGCVQCCAQRACASSVCCCRHPPLRTAGPAQPPWPDVHQVSKTCTRDEPPPHPWLCTTPP
jgi:hypothetical protein